MIRKSLLPLAVCVAAFASSAPPAGASVHGACAQNLEPLGANAIGPAAAAALRADPAKNEPRVTGATLAPQDGGRGPQAKAQCGKTVWQRTVVVYVLDRAFLPAESAAQRVLFVGRTSDGYRVWARAH